MKSSPDSGCKQEKGRKGRYISFFEKKTKKQKEPRGCERSYGGLKITKAVYLAFVCQWLFPNEFLTLRHTLAFRVFFFYSLAEVFFLLFPLVGLAKG